MRADLGEAHLGEARRGEAYRGEAPRSGAHRAHTSLGTGRSMRLRPGRRALLSTALAAAACVALAALAPPPAWAQPTRAFDLDALMALLAQRKSGEARFTEERTVTGFEEPLRASGTLSFSAPDRFVRQTLLPQRERLEVAGNTVRLERGARVRQMTLDAVPELAALVEGLRGTLTGNAALLRKHFDVRVAGQPGLWTLTLTPLDSPLDSQSGSLVRSLQLVGTAGDLRTVELRMAGNERSLMTIEPLPAPGPASTKPAAPPVAPAALATSAAPARSAAPAASAASAAPAASVAPSASVAPNPR